MIANVRRFAISVGNDDMTAQSTEWAPRAQPGMLSSWRSEQRSSRASRKRGLRRSAMHRRARWPIVWRSRRRFAKHTGGYSVELQPEWNEFLSSLTRRGVRFLLIGGLAVAAHGHERYTKDLDVLVESSVANARRLGRALVDYGFHATGRAAQNWMTAPERMIKLGREPLRIDILTSIAGVAFESAWKRRATIRLGGLTIPVIGLAELRANKLAAGRPQDIADVALLDEITRAASRSRRTRRRPAARRSRTPGRRRR
jgi:predicted nucleotidyltransferase